MTADYSGAIWQPCKNFWPGNNSMQKIVIHGTASGAQQTAYQLATSSEFNDGTTASVHYINDKDGTVYQIVQETDSAWGNCCISGPEAPAGYYPLPGAGQYHLRGLDSTVNQNHSTISIENMKYASDNSDTLTDAQYSSLVKLVADIATRRKIRPTRENIIGHFDLDPATRARCPGTFNWTMFYRDVQITMGYGPINTELALYYAAQAGFQGDNLYTIVAIASDESDLMPFRQGVNISGTLDRGILQFNSYWHPEITDAQAYDPAEAFKQAYRITGGTDFSAWSSYKTGTYKNYLGSIMPPLSSTGEIADFCDADQFQPAKTQDACGYFSVACVDAAAPVGKPCTKTVAQVVTEALTWYTQYDGDNTISNGLGMNLNQLYQLLKQVGLQYYPLTTNKTQISTWLKAGFPVIVCVTEDSVYDLALQAKPYYWNTSGLNHIVTLTGLNGNNYLVRDSANVEDLYNPTTLRPGPRTYDSNKLNVLWAVAIVMHGQFMPSVQGGLPVGIPTGWKDDGTVLTNPVNKNVVRDGFRLTVLNWPGGWEAWNVPLENEHPSNPLENSNPSLGAGTSQMFVNRRLEWQASTNHCFAGWLGQETMWYVNQLTTEAAKETADQTQIANDKKTISDLTSQVSSLQAQLASATPVSVDEQTAINNAVAALTALQQYKK